MSLHVNQNISFPKFVPNLINFCVEQAKVEDAKTITNLVCAAFKEGDVFRNPHYPRLTINEVIQHFSFDNHIWFLVVLNTAKKSKEIAAAILYVSKSPEEATTHCLSAWPKYRGYKFGALLRQHCDAYAKSEGKQKISFQVASVNKSLIEYYKIQGFRLTNDVEEYFQDALMPEWKGRVFTLRMEKIFSHDNEGRTIEAHEERGGIAAKDMTCQSGYQSHIQAIYTKLAPKT